MANELIKYGKFYELQLIISSQISAYCFKFERTNIRYYVSFV